MRRSASTVVVLALCVLVLVGGRLAYQRGWISTGDGFGSRGGDDPASPGDAQGQPLPSLSLPSRGSTVVCAFIVVGDFSTEVAAQYNLEKLKYVENDAAQLAQDFQHLGVPKENLFNLKHTDATTKGIVDLLQQVAAKVKPDDIVFVFFFGHGLGQNEQESRLVAYDGPVSVKALLEAMGKIPAAKLVLSIDACRSGSPGSPQFSVSSNLFGQERGLAWISSARPDQRAYEPDSLKHGVFSYFLSQILRNSDSYDRNRDGWLDFEEIAGPVKSEVKKWTQNQNKEQEPLFGTVKWQDNTKLLAVQKQWSVDVTKAVHLAPVKVRFLPAALGPNDRLWLVVAPRETPGRYYPQPQAIITATDGPVWTGKVYLGNATVGLGEEFRVLLVAADRELHGVFRQAPPDGLLNPPILSLPIKAEQTVKRTQ